MKSSKMVISWVCDFEFCIAQLETYRLLTIPGSQALSKLRGQSPAQADQQRFLITLAQSTATLSELVAVIGSAVQHKLIPRGSEFSLFSNRIVNVEGLLQAASPVKVPRPLGPPGSRGADILRGGPGIPAKIVPAAPWTRISSDEIFVSRLVSVFVDRINPYWRYVEDDLFLRDMISGQSGSYCSPLLVNAICAIACVSSTRKRTPMIATNHVQATLRILGRIRRTRQFSHERSAISRRGTRAIRGGLSVRSTKVSFKAMRLWYAEMGTSSLTHVQALTILSME